MYGKVKCTIVATGTQVRGRKDVLLNVKAVGRDDGMFFKNQHPLDGIKFH